MLTFFPGPSQVYAETGLYLQEAFQSGILSVSHRSEAFNKLSEETLKLLRFKLDIPENYTILYTSSATESWEIISQSLVSKQSAHFSSGAFGDKWFQYAKAIHPTSRKFSIHLNEELHPEYLDINSEDEVVCLTQNETSNGTQISFETIAAIRGAFPDKLIALDCTSSMAGINLPFILGDIWFASVQKCFGLPAGLGLLILSPAAVNRAKEIGDKKHLIEMSWKNARYSMKEKLAQYDLLNPEHKTERLLSLMKQDLRMHALPQHIECFDNSNFQGSYAVGAMSVFKDGKPSKKDYRHFDIKTVVGPDDFASMEEIIYRRYKRLLDEQQPLPQLIVIDGGKGQLSSALTSLEKLNLRGKITIIGIAKKLEEIYFPGDSIPLYLDKKGETLKIIQQLRDEVHRFGITHHRNKRSKGFIKTELEEIKGIGKATADNLLREFKFVNRIKEASEQEIATVIGSAKAKIVKAFFEKNGESESEETI